MAMYKESIANILFITLAVCLVCAVVVSTAAVGLRPLYEENKQRDIQMSVLEVAGIKTNEETLDTLFDAIEVRIVDLGNGLFADIDPNQFDMQESLRDPAMIRTLSKKEDIARISVRPNYAKVYLIKNEGILDKVVLPIHGYGLWSVLYGFIAVEEDGRTVYNIKFYDHAETPGLGGEVDNSAWRKLWRGKHLYDNQGQPKLSVLKGSVPLNSKDRAYQIDGLSGATLTSYGVSQMIRFWSSNMGYRPFLNNIATRAVG